MENVGVQGNSCLISLRKKNKSAMKWSISRTDSESVLKPGSALDPPSDDPGITCLTNLTEIILEILQDFKAVNT